ncbi:hypothetical protein [Pseudomonas sp. ML96]|uniref:hypothetical protein n=1 Tax=Pseudomonas sp. ML96 TaxID=1523503 RepID=UPI0005B9FF1D|nr:hypothetical protein [Pseudomonas sp. ML96]
MSQELQPHPLAKPIRRLTIAVWVVGLALAAQLLMTLLPFLFPHFYAGRVTQIAQSANATLAEHSETRTQASTPPGAKHSPSPAIDFYELPLQQKIEKASAIALIRNDIASDGTLRPIIQEFLKKAPDASITYAVGDEFEKPFLRNQTSYGDGAIVFFLGSPAKITHLIQFSGDRVLQLEDISLTQLREKCKAAQGAPNSAVQ